MQGVARQKAVPYYGKVTKRAGFFTRFGQVIITWAEWPVEIDRKKERAV